MSLLKRIVTAFVLVLLAAVLTHSASAQCIPPPLVAISSAASGLPYSESTPTYPMGMKSYIALYPVGCTGIFDTQGQSVSCTPSFGNSCAGLELYFVKDQVEYPAAISYASPSQINAIVPVLPTNQVRYGVRLKYSGTLNYERQHNEASGFIIHEKRIQPFLYYGTLGGTYGAYYVGSLYGYTVNGSGQITGSVYLKSLTDGTANPRSYNGYPTIPQIYFTGVYDHTSGGNGIAANWGAYGGGFTSADVNATVYEEAIGFYLRNLLIPTNYIWDAGNQSATVHYSTPGQGDILSGKIYFGN